MTDIDPREAEQGPPDKPAPSYADRLVQQGQAANAIEVARQAGRPYRSARTRGNVVLALLGVSLVVSVVSAAINVWGWLTMDAFLSDRATIADLESFDNVFAMSGLIETAIFIATALAWLSWQSRTVDNIGPLRIGPSPWSPAASIVWWFIPIANLIQPYRIHADLWRRYMAMTAARLVLAWWLLWVVSNVATNLAGRYWLLVDTVEAFDIGLLAWFAADLLSAASAVLAITLVRRLQARADSLAGNLPPPIDAPAAPSVAAT